MNFPFAIFKFVFFVTTVFAQTGLEVASYFRKHLSSATGVYLPSESNYTLETTNRWNAFSAPTYIVSVKPKTDLDVRKIVRRYASRRGNLKESTNTSR